MDKDIITSHSAIMTNTSIKTILSALVGAIVVVVLAFVLVGSARQASASVAVSNEYVATTTFAASSPLINVIKPGPGTVGSVIITGKNTGLITLYDATTSDVTKRTGSTATSTIIIADFPTNAPEGTYTFDAQTKYGILAVESGAVATTTITYR